MVKGCQEKLKVKMFLIILVTTPAIVAEKERMLNFCSLTFQSNSTPRMTRMQLELYVYTDRFPKISLICCPKTEPFPSKHIDLTKLKYKPKILLGRKKSNIYNIRSHIDSVCFIQLQSVQELEECIFDTKQCWRLY